MLPPSLELSRPAGQDGRFRRTRLTGWLAAAAVGLATLARVADDAAAHTAPVCVARAGASGVALGKVAARAQPRNAEEPGWATTPATPAAARVGLEVPAPGRGLAAHFT